MSSARHGRRRRVDVPLDHFIGGARVPSTRAHRGALADRRLASGRGRRRRSRRGRRRGRRGARRLPRLGGARPEGRARVLDALADGDPRAQRRPRRRRDRRQRLAADRQPQAGGRPRRPQHLVLRRLGALGSAHPVDLGCGDRQPRPLRPRRRRRADHAVERAAHARRRGRSARRWRPATPSCSSRRSGRR